MLDDHQMPSPPLFNGDGTLNDGAAKAHVHALVVELMKRDKAAIASMLAIEMVNQEIQRGLDAQIKAIEEKGLATVREVDQLKDQLLEIWEGRRKEWLTGVRLGHSQRARRLDKPTSDPYDQGRNSRLRNYHARLVADGVGDATSQTAGEFGLSARQVRNILKNMR